MTSPVVDFPDVEQLVIDHLIDERDDDVSITGDVPNPRPDRFITVLRGGGPQLNLVTDQPIVLLECWGSDDAAGIAEANDLARWARRTVHAMRHRRIRGVTVYRVDEVGGPQRLPDPDTSQPRVVFTVSLSLRGSAI